MNSKPLVSAWQHYNRVSKSEIWLTVEHTWTITDDVIIRKVRHYKEDEPAEVIRVKYPTWLEWTESKQMVAFVPTIH